MRLVIQYTNVMHTHTHTQTHNNNNKLITDTKGQKGHK